MQGGENKMSLESVFKLSILVGLIDQFSGPSARINRTLGNTSGALKDVGIDLAKVARDGAVLVGTGKEITEWVSAPVKSSRLMA